MLGKSGFNYYYHIMHAVTESMQGSHVALKALKSPKQYYSVSENEIICH